MASVKRLDGWRKKIRTAAQILFCKTWCPRRTAVQSPAAVFKQFTARHQLSTSGQDPRPKHFAYTSSIDKI